MASGLIRGGGAADDHHPSWVGNHTKTLGLANPPSNRGGKRLPCTECRLSLQTEDGTCKVSLPSFILPPYHHFCTTLTSSPISASGGLTREVWAGGATISRICPPHHTASTFPFITTVFTRCQFLGHFLQRVIFINIDYPAEQEGHYLGGSSSRTNDVELPMESPI